MTRTPLTRRTTARLGGLVAAGLLALTACGASAAPPATTPASEAAGTAGTPHALTPRDVDAWLDGFLPAALEREGVQGATVAVVDDGRVVTTRGFGWADVEEERPVDPADTLFRVGSISKVFTATAVMQLIEDGAVDLDTDVQTYVDTDLGLDRPVTLRHLLTHTGGFEEKVSGLIGGPDATVDLEDAVTTDPPEQVYEPGTTPAYSNHGNALAGLVVQEVSGERFEDHVADEVLAPLGMDSSSFAQPLPGDLADRLASGYAGPDAAPTPFETVGTAPAGALTSSADDMARFMLAQLGESDTPLLQPATLERMHAPALDADDLGGLATGSRMTLGFFDRSQNGHRVIEHGGDTTVFHSDLALWPDDGAGIFVSLNGSGAEATSTLTLRDGLVEGFADRYLPGDEPQPARPSTDQADSRAAAMAGTYESSRTVRSNFLSAMYAVGHTTITDAGDGRLLVSPGPNRAGPSLMEPVGDWTWREVEGDRVIAARTTGGEDPRVAAIGYDSAFTLLPVTAAHSTATLAVAGGSAVVLAGAAVGALLVAPAAWLRRRRRATAEERAGRRTGRTLRVLSRVGVVAAVLALVGWGLTVTSVMTFAEPGAWAIRQVQLLQLVALLGVVPAVLRVLDEARRRAGWWRLGASALVALALVGVGWAALALHLLSPDITY